MKSHKLTVLFDAGPLVNGEKSGIGQYASRLIDTLAGANPDILLVGHYFNFLGRKQPILPRHPNLIYKESKIIPGKVLSVCRRFGFQLPFELFIKSRGDIALFPNFVSLPCVLPIKKVIIIHDLIFDSHPQYLQPANQKFLQKFVPKSLISAARVITISRNTKKEIVDKYKYPQDKIAIITPAVDQKVFKPLAKEKVEMVLRKYKINKPYILSVGTIEPRKNLVGVLDAFEKLPAEIKNSYALVLTGGKGWLDDEINQKYNELAKNYSVIKTGYVENDELPALYSGASVFVFPSFYEGFGIPPLEAMACGTPVITSNNSSLPEVAGDAAIMIDADNTSVLTKEIVRVLENSKLASELSGKGIAQAKGFSWDQSAKELLQLLENLK